MAHRNTQDVVLGGLLGRPGNILDGMHPQVEQLRLPKEYGSPTKTLAWPDVRRRLERALRYWLVTIRPDGGPHAVPVDGLWLDDIWYFGGVATTLHMRNVSKDQRVVMHLADADAAVIVDGSAELVVPPAEMVDRLVNASTEKYGYSPGHDAYAGGVWALRPRRVIAWNDLPEDASRFLFDTGG